MQIRTLLLLTLLITLPLAGCADTTTTPATTTPAAGVSPATSTPLSTSPATGTSITEDFEGASVGQLPAGWTLVAGEWSIQDNTSAPKGSKVLLSNQTDLGETLVLADKAGNWSDLEARVMFNVHTGEKGQAGGIVFRYEDEKNYYVVRYNHNELSWNLFRTMEGKREKFSGTDASASFQGGLDQWSELRVVATGPHIAVYSGETKVIDYVEEDPSAAPQSGKIGLWTRYDSKTEFDDFSVSPN